jgi:hypothetical protein
MGTLSFGQPDNGIMQMAYVVPDIRAAIEDWIRDLNVGPWFLLDSFTGVDPLYRGAPTTTDVAIAMSFAGHMQIELIQPNDDTMSVYRETIEARGYGFHHHGVATRNFPHDLERYVSRGYPIAFQLGVPTGGTVAYIDTLGETPGFIELIEATPDMEATFGRFWQAAQNWDGRDPVRPFG